MFLVNGEVELLKRQIGLVWRLMAYEKICCIVEGGALGWHSFGGKCWWHCIFCIMNSSYKSTGEAHGIKGRLVVANL